MKTTPSQKIKIGIFSMAGLAILVVGIFVIGSKKNMFGDTFAIYGKFRNVGGLQIGNNVRFAGINVGTVEGIIIENDTIVRVDLRLQSRVKPFLKSDATASIGSDGLMGDKLVVISPGDSGNNLMEKDGRVNTINPVEFDKVIGRFTNVVHNAEIITASLADISSQISGGKGSLGRLIYTDSLEKGLEGTVNSAHATMDAAKEGVAGFKDNMTALKHNFLLKGYYKHKNREAGEKADKEAAAEDKQAKKDARKERKQQRKDRKNGTSAADSTAH